MINLYFTFERVANSSGSIFPRYFSEMKPPATVPKAMIVSDPNVTDLPLILESEEFSHRIEIMWLLVSPPMKLHEVDLLNPKSREGSIHDLAHVSKVILCKRALIGDVLSVELDHLSRIFPVAILESLEGFTNQFFDADIDIPEVESRDAGFDE